MSHLGELISALVDGELSGAELDRANAHVAACGACRMEANALRRLKHELRGLAELSDAGDITSRLLAMSAHDGPPCPDNLVPARDLGREHGPRRRVRVADGYSLADPYSDQASARPVGRRRGRYVLWGTLSLVAVGVGTAFGMGGSASPAEPRITPQLEVFDAQHAMVSGDVPFDDPADVSGRVPAVAATP